MKKDPWRNLCLASLAVALILSAAALVWASSTGRPRDQPGVAAAARTSGRHEIEVADVPVGETDPRLEVGGREEPPVEKARRTFGA
jgi:hypothetical protein